MSLTSSEASGSIADPAASHVVFETSLGTEIQAGVLRLMLHSATFEIFDPTLVLRASEALGKFRIVLRNNAVYSGSGIVRSLLNSGTGTICEVALDPQSWQNELLAPGMIQNKKLGDEFKGFVRGWQKFYRVRDDYKVVIADIQTFLADLRLWLEQVEASIRLAPEAEQIELEQKIAQGLRAQVSSTLNNMFEDFEVICDKIEEDLQPVHRAFGQRQLHPYLLCAPFIHRTYTKPLGYAGDYEMMNMIVRNGLEGNSLYAKLANAYLLDQAGSQAVRNRVGFLTGKIVEETGRVARLGQTANIFSIACGPAWEAVNFVTDHPLADCAQFHLLDFNEETLRHTGNRMEEGKTKHQRKTSVKLDRNSVQNLLRGRNKPGAGELGYDLIYCSGLYDYLNDRVIKALNTYLYDQLRPGGLLVVGNFAPSTPVRNFIEHLLEWFLIYRDGRELAALAPTQAAEADCKVVAESTGANIFLEVRKPR